MASKSIKIDNYKTDIPGKIDPDDNTVFMFPQIVSQNNKSGKKTYWRALVRVFTENNSGDKHYLPLLPEYFNPKHDMEGKKALIVIVSKLEGGKVRDVTPTIINSGKNLGKANETNVFTQALRDALGLHNKHLQIANYSGPETIIPGKEALGPKSSASPENLAAQIYEKTGVLARFYPPMLAKLRDVQNITFPAYVQPKLNGVRVVIFYDAPTKNIYVYSRNKKAYPGFDYIIKELAPILAEHPGLYLDGEMYKHGMSLQEISGYARRALSTSINAAEKLEYNVFDAFRPDQDKVVFSERQKWLDPIFNYKFAHIKRVPTTQVKNEEEIRANYDKWLKDGYEGAIIRLDAPYVYSYHHYHTPVLLKMKLIMEGEYTIVGYTRGKKGKAADALMLTLETPEGKRFDVTPAMPLPDRNKLYAKMGEKGPDGKTYFERHYLGKPYTIQYQELSKDNIPVQARGEVVRDYE